MTDNNRFFRWVWRFNGVVLALILLSVVGMAGYEHWRSWTRHDSDGPVGVFAPVPNAGEQNATFRLVEGASEVGGLTLTSGALKERFLQLRRWEGPPQSYGLASSFVEKEPILDAVSLLIVNAKSGKARWMFTGYNRRITSAERIYDAGPIEPDPSEPGVTGPNNPVVLVLNVLENDNNRDGVLDSKDRVSLYGYRAGMAKPVKFLSATLIISTRQVGADTYQVIYEDGRKAFAATFATADFKLLSQEPLPKLPS